MTAPASGRDGPLIRVLSLDGGGVRGVMAATIAAELERLAGVPIVELFDLFSGSSAGASLALLLNKPGANGGAAFSAAACAERYLRDINRIFRRSRLHALRALGGLRRPRCSMRTVQDALDRTFGDAQLKDAVCDLLLPVYDVRQGALRLFTRRAAARDPRDNFFMRDVARATSAAPTWFPIARIRSVAGHASIDLVDGGVFARNPAACALVEAMRLHGPRARYLVVSIGTGRFQNGARDLGGGPLERGLWGWIPHLADLFFGSQSAIADWQARSLLEEHRFFRLEPPLARDRHAVEDASPENLRALQRAALDYVRQHAAELTRLAGLLLAPRDQAVDGRRVV
jgi:patatin-like phospholipase/acyl hydrolase